MRGRVSTIAASLLLAALAAAPTASAAVTANAGPDRTVDTGQSVTFDGTGSTATGESIASYNWDFGDGTTGSGSTATKTYTSAGTYTVTLLVIGTAGSTAVDSATVVARTTDTSAPNITHTPSTSGTANSAITLSATVTDNIGVQAATLFYKRSNETTYQSTSMTCSGSATSQSCNGTIPSSVTDGAAVNYYLRAQDTRSGTPNTGYYPANAPTANLTITLTDTAAPTITHAPPASATAGSNLNVTATVADTVAVSAVTLYYDFNDSTTFSLNATMTRASGTAANGTYYAVISGSQLPAGGTVKYYVQANDTSNNVARLPSGAPGCFGAGTCSTTTIGVTSAAAPNVTYAPPASATAGQDVTVTATVAPGAGRAISSVMVRYRSLGNATDFDNLTMTNSTSANVYTATIPGAAVTDRGVEFFIRANDTEGEVTRSPSAGSSAPYQLATPPGTPTGVGATRSSAGVTVAWTAPTASATSSVGSHKVYRSTDGTSYSVLATVAAPAVSYLDAAAIDGVRYHYKVSAVDDFSTEGSLSAAALTADRGYRPAAPSVALTTPSAGSIAVSFTATAQATGWYLVETSTDNATYTLVQNVTAAAGATTLGASAGGLAGGTLHYVRVRPFNPYNEAGTAAVATATPTSASTGAPPSGGASAPPPSVTIASPSAGAVVTGPVTITGTAGGSGLERVEVTISGAGTSTATGTTSWSYAWNPAGLANGNYVITARAVAGAISSQQSVAVTLDLAQPAATPTPTPTPPSPTPGTPSTPAPASPTPTASSPGPTPSTPVSPTLPTASTPASQTPAASSPTPSAPVQSSQPTPTPIPTPTPSKKGGIPGFEASLVALAALAAAGVLALGRRRG